MLPPKVKKTLEKQQYRIAGNHSAVQICHWTKNSLNNKGVCRKEKFYGIKSHRCCQFSPAVMWCENKCLHCWRQIEMNLGMKIGKTDEPKEILDKIIEERKKLLFGFKGNKKVLRKKFEESLKPTLFTLSLSGEPTIYPKLAEMLKEIRKRKCISFLVTNGQSPNILKELEEKKALPTQLIVSVNAPNKKLFEIWHNSLNKDAWERINETLELIKELEGKTRRVVRLTLVKKGEEKEKFQELSNMEEEHVKEYANLIRKAEPDFVHVKGFKSLGYSRQRLGYSKQPLHEEVGKFSEKLAGELKNEKYKILGEEERSCVVLIGKDKKKIKIKEQEI